MATVYIIQDNGKFNLTAAQEYGEPVTLLPARLQLQHNCDAAVQTISDKLLNYTSEDSLLAVGDPAAIGIAVAIAAFYNGGNVSILKFDRQTNAYYRVPIDLTGFFEAEVENVYT